MLIRYLYLLFFIKMLFLVNDFVVKIHIIFYIDIIFSTFFTFLYFKRDCGPNS